ncbi:TetR/AcrR family transcriptional regulator [Brachybacterium sacelli]|uniref:AcrR family transcriptional regulator n=1 Tax=Brachybacterium sacelli TaxID=173364 RepID=A0ABS4WYJ6_9MICO|nr:TetR/AcrR family transcriptional regulator [Brachybacterium sacelli]MBP2381277.1 AcrR family transcriptional regulator [Brachybacterium sacelli]
MPRPRIPDRRERILDAARDLALEEGWPATTVAHIAAAAGIGKGAVYLEFADKTAILDAELRRAMRRLTAAVHRRVTTTTGLIDLTAVYRFGLEELLDEPLMRAFQLGDESVLGDHVRAVGDDRYQQRMGWLGDYIARLQDAGLIAPEIDRATLGHLLGVFTLGLLSAPTTLGPIPEQTLRDTVALFAELVGRGLDPGRPVDPEAARDAQLALLENLETQLDHLDDPDRPQEPEDSEEQE